MSDTPITDEKKFPLLDHGYQSPIDIYVVPEDVSAVLERRLRAKERELNDALLELGSIQSCIAEQFGLERTPITSEEIMEVIRDRFADMYVQMHDAMMKEITVRCICHDLIQKVRAARNVETLDPILDEIEGRLG